MGLSPVSDPLLSLGGSMAALGVFLRPGRMWTPVTVMGVFSTIPAVSSPPVGRVGAISGPGRGLGVMHLSRTTLLLWGIIAPGALRPIVRSWRLQVQALPEPVRINGP